MQRYFIENESFASENVVIKGNDFHHMKHVMRFKLNDRIIISNYAGQSFLAEIILYDKHELICKIVEEIFQQKNHLNISLAQSLIRKDHFELVLQKATELGVKEIIPLQANRSIVKIHDEQKKSERYTAILKEASEQSERAYVPVLREPSDVFHLPYEDYDLVIVAYARENHTNTLAKAINQTNPNQNILALIGPEGGFSEEELSFLKSKALFVSLGNTILRSETAAIYLISAFRYAWGDMV